MKVFPQFLLAAMVATGSSEGDDGGGGGWPGTSSGSSSGSGSGSYTGGNPTPSPPTPYPPAGGGGAGPAASGGAGGNDTGGNPTPSPPTPSPPTPYPPAGGGGAGPAASGGAGGSYTGGNPTPSPPTPYPPAGGGGAGPAAGDGGGGGSGSSGSGYGSSYGGGMPAGMAAVAPAPTPVSPPDAMPSDAAPPGQLPHWFFMTDEQGYSYALTPSSFSKPLAWSAAAAPQAALVHTALLGDPWGEHIANQSRWQMAALPAPPFILISARGGSYAAKAAAAHSVGALATLTYSADPADALVQHTPCAINGNSSRAAPAFFVADASAVKLFAFNCQDDNVLCRTWAKNGECGSNAQYMRTQCKRACKACAPHERFDRAFAAPPAPGTWPVKFSIAGASQARADDLAAVRDLYHRMENRRQWKYGRVGGRKVRGTGVAPWTSFDELPAPADVCGAVGRRLWGVWCVHDRVVSIDLTGVANLGNAWSMPSSIGALSELRALTMTGLRGIGALPDTMASLGALLTLRLGGNCFNGTFPEMKGRPRPAGPTTGPAALTGSALVHLDVRPCQNTARRAISAMAHASRGYPALQSAYGVAPNATQMPAVLAHSPASNMFLRYVGTENADLGAFDLDGDLTGIVSHDVDYTPPTAAPTPGPTPPTPPTASPTPNPTASPTPNPTASPTPNPTASPTPNPTASPTPSPSASPTPSPSASPTPAPTPSPTPLPDGVLVKTGHECMSSDAWMADNANLQSCTAKCRTTSGCSFFILGQNGTAKDGACWWEKTASEACPEGWLPKAYNFYKLTNSSSPAGSGSGSGGGGSYGGGGGGGSGDF